MCLGYVRYSVSRISSPSLYRYYLHVFPISRNCLAPPHSPESPHRAFIPQCIYSPLCTLVPCEFLLYSYFILTLYLLYTYLSSLLISVIVLCLNIFVIPVSCFGPAYLPCPCPCPVSLVFLFFIGLCLLVFSVLILRLLLPVFVLLCVLFMFGPLVYLS